MPVGFSKACRTCLTLDGTLISIYDSISYDGMGRVTDIIKDITKIRPMKSDGLPELVCQTCLNEINRCYSFKVKCLNSDSTLRKLFATEEELEAQTHQQVGTEEKEYKPIIQNLVSLYGADEVDSEYEPPVKIKTEKDQDDLSYGYFVITSVCSQGDETNGGSVEEPLKTFQPPQGYIKEEIDYEIDSYNTSSTRHLTFGDVYMSDQSQCFDNISFEFTYPQIKMEPEEPLQMDSPIMEFPTTKPSFKCLQCSKEFLYSSRLKKHMRSHNSKPYSCSTCSKGFKLSAQLRNHIDVAHRKIKPFKCEECPRTFSFPSKLKEHLRSHKGSRHYKSYYSLPGIYTEKKEKIEHTNELNEQSIIIECPDEKKSDVTRYFDESNNEQPPIWTNERSTRRSARIHREELKTPDNGQKETQPNSSTSEISGTKKITRQSEKLTQVDYSFDGQDSNHEEKNSSEGSRQFNCPHCTKVFKYLSRLNEHVVCHSDARPFDCVNCGKFFKTPGQLTRHIKTSHILSLRGRRNPFAKKRRGLKRKNVNKNIVRTAAEIKSLESTTENDEHSYEESIEINPGQQDANMIEGENENSTTEAHKDESQILNKDKLLNESSNSLSVIEAKAAKSDDLQESYETEEISTEAPKTYHCEKCDETFIVSARFYKHMRGHGIERPFICSICGKGFKNGGNLKSHIVITHKKLKPFKCNDCKRAFSCKSNLKKHLISRIWTHSCTKEITNRRGGSKKKIKNKKLLNFENENNESNPSDDTITQKQEILATAEKIKYEITNDDKGKQNQKCPTEEINEKLSSTEVNVQEPDIGLVEDKTNFVESKSVGMSTDVSKPEQLNQPNLDTTPNQVEEISPKKKPKNRYECPHCKKVFVYESYLKKHLQSHSDERPFICTICDKAFKYKVSLKSHNMITHAKIKPYKCDKCPQAFVNEYTYRVHRNSHNKVIKRKTKTRRRRALAKPDIVQSTSVDVDQNNTNLGSEGVDLGNNDMTSCSICSSSVQIELLTEHMKQNHNIIETTNVPVNPKSHSNEEENLGSAPNKFECPDCKKIFLFASYLKKHMRCHNNERPHVCSNCGKAFKDYWRLRSHIKEKHPSHSKKIIHRQKRRKLNRDKHLIAFERNVDSNEPTLVDETSDISNIPQDLMNLSLNEENSLDKSSQDAQEGVKTTNSNESEVPIGDLVKPQCTLCNRVFQFASQLETHMRTHTGERPFACTTCKKTFTQKGHLKNHILIDHKKIMPFQCSVCLRGFASGFNMRVHEKTHFNPRRKKVKSNVKKSGKPPQGSDKNSAVETTTTPIKIAQDDLQDQVIMNFEKLELHPLFESMSSSPNPPDQNTNNRTDQNCFFPCTQCKKTFVFLSDLNEHIKTHNANARPFNCSICYKTFRQEAHLKIHTQMSHTKTRNFKCDECDRVFLTFYILNKHLRSHKGKKKRNKVKVKGGHRGKGTLLPKSEYSDQFCTNIESDETNKQLIETICNDEENTENVNTSKEQQISAEADAENKNIQITCALCNVAVDSDDLTEHMKECLSISQPSSILLKTEPLEEPQSMQHPLFRTLSTKDQEIDTGITKQCMECEKEFFTFALFADHMKTHNVEKPFICKTCDKGFKKNAHLKSHIMIVHKRILPYKCIDCSRAFSSKYNLQMHLKTHNAKGNLKKGSSKRRVVVKKSYYKDPTYHAKPVNIEDANQNPTSGESQPENEIEEDTFNYQSIQNPIELHERQIYYGRNENKIRCTLCFISVNTEHLSKHMQEFHNLPQSLTCMAIKKEPLEESEQLGNRSLEIETGQPDTPRRLQCPTCDKEFIHLSRLNEHMRAHSDERPFICLVCGKTFKRHGHLTAHIAMCHKKAKPFKCKECHQIFSSSLDLDVHLQTHLSDHSRTEQNEVNQLEPRQNDESLPPSNIGADLIVERTADEAHQCTLCPTVFKSISNLMEHMKVHTSDQPFICSLCGKGFISNDDLVTHRLIMHNEPKPYHCDQCTRKFRTSLELQNHTLVHTGNCQRIQKLNRQRKRQNETHNLDLNKELLSYSKDAPHCRICKKNFTNNWVLKEHMKCHSSVKPFVCPICKHGFSKKYNLKIHVMAHKKIKPFKCLYCPQSYCTNSGRTHHMRTHTHGRKRINNIDSLNAQK